MSDPIPTYVTISTTVTLESLEHIDLDAETAARLLGHFTPPAPVSEPRDGHPISYGARVTDADMLDAAGAPLDMVSRFADRLRAVSGS